MIRRPPRSTRTDTLFPYTTLFRAGFGHHVDHPVRSPETDLDTEPEGCTFAARTQRFRRRLCVERLVELVVAAGAHAADGDGEDAVPTHLGDRVEDRVARTFGCLSWKIGRAHV